jgi:hypothetical protein
MHDHSIAAIQTPIEGVEKNAFHALDGLRRPSTKALEVIAQDLSRQ